MRKHTYFPFRIVFLALLLLNVALIVTDICDNNRYDWDNLSPLANYIGTTFKRSSANIFEILDIRTLMHFRTYRISFRFRYSQEKALAHTWL